jgi:hypothetical protein
MEAFQGRAEEGQGMTAGGYPPSGVISSPVRRDKPSIRLRPSPPGLRQEGSFWSPQKPAIKRLICPGYVVGFDQLLVL